MITRASEDAGDKTEYCTVQDVRTHLAGVGMDDAGEPFGAFWSSDVFNERVRKLLPVGKKEVDRMAGRDFCYHEDVDIAMDGAGTQYLPFDRFGFVPLIEVSELSIEGTVQDLTDYVTYQDGRFGPVTWFADNTELTSTSWMNFPLGRQNIVMTVTWGYTDVPVDMEVAAAYMVGYHLAITMDSAQDLQKPGLIGGATTVKYGDMTIGIGGKGLYERLAARLKSAASQLCGGYYTPIVTAPQPKKATLSPFEARYIRTY